MYTFDDCSDESDMATDIDSEVFKLVRKRQRSSTGKDSGQRSKLEFVLEFDKLNIDRKLSIIFDTLIDNQDRFVKLELYLDSIIRKTNRMECMETVINSYDDD